MMHAGVLLSVLGLVASTSLSLDGFIGEGFERCGAGQSCNNRPSGPHRNITHGDLQQSCLWLNCEADYYTLILESPHLTRYHSFELLGWGDNSLSNSAGCKVEQYNKIDIVGNGKSGDLPEQLKRRFAYQACGSGVSDKVTKVYQNKVRLLEFVNPGNAPTGNGENTIYLTSETLIDIQCCRSSTGAPCTPGGEPPIIPIILSDCNEKEFALTCGVNEAEEVFRCELAIAKDVVLGTSDVEFYVDSCTGITPNRRVSLYEAKSTNNADLEVRTHSFNNKNERKFRIQTAYFADQESLPEDPVAVQICCTVKFAPAGSINNYLSSDPDLQANPFTRASSPLIQAAPVKLIK